MGNFNPSTWVTNLEQTLQNNVQCPDGGHFEMIGNTSQWVCDDAGGGGYGNIINQSSACGYNVAGNCVEGGTLGPCNCPDPEGSCFHPDTTVELEDGTIKTMRQVNYGDKVKAVDKEGNIIFSEVWEDEYFNYKDNTTPKYYITIKAGDKILKTTTMHTIFVDSLKKNMNAHKVKPGMYINVLEGRNIVRKMVDSVTHSMDHGLYDLYTKEGTVIVNGVVAGTLAFWPHKFAQWWHKFFNNHPKLYALTFKYIYNPIFSYFYSGKEEMNLRKQGV